MYVLAHLTFHPRATYIFNIFQYFQDKKNSACTGKNNPSCAYEWYNICLINSYTFPHTNNKLLTYTYVP